MIMIQRPNDLFSKVIIYEVTKDNCVYSLFKNTKQARDLLASWGLQQGEQKEEYNESCKFIWIRRNDFVFLNSGIGDGFDEVMFVDDIPYKISNDRDRKADFQICIKRVEE